MSTPKIRTKPDLSIGSAKHQDAIVIGYIIVSYGDDSSQDFIAGYGKRRQVYLKKSEATKAYKALQKEYDEDDPNNPYDFQLEEIEIIL